MSRYSLPSGSVRLLNLDGSNQMPGLMTEAISKMRLVPELCRVKGDRKKFPTSVRFTGQISRQRFIYLFIYKLCTRAALLNTHTGQVLK